MENIKNNNMNFYALYNKNTGAFGCIITSTSDKEACQFYINSFDASFDDLKQKNPDELPRFMERVNECSIFRLAYLNPLKGVFKNCKAFLMDLEINKNIDEKEVIKNE